MLAKYTNVRILVSLLKQYNVATLVISPGTKHLGLVKSVEDDPFFTCYSVIDERSAAYFATGLTLTNGPVALLCTSAQATRNYIPGLTEAYYRGAPVLAITADYDESYVAYPQVIDQLAYPHDAVHISVDLPSTSSQATLTLRVNQALDALSKGPSHINIRMEGHWAEGPAELTPARKITRFAGKWPTLKSPALLVLGPGQHRNNGPMAAFVETNDVAVYTSHISNYYGPKSVRGGVKVPPDTIITYGGPLGDYKLLGNLRGKGIPHWHLGSEFADTYGSLTWLLPPDEFFKEYTKSVATGTDYVKQWPKFQAPQDNGKLSQLLVAKTLGPRLPKGCNLHFSILNALRTWDKVPLDRSINCYSNVAAFGIDGALSTFLGHAVSCDKPCFAIVGDLAFYYDMNILGNRHLRGNAKIVLINNHGGAEFLTNNHPASSYGSATVRHTAAMGHFGRSAEGWATDNNLTYYPCNKTEDLGPLIDKFIEPADRPALLEVQVEVDNEC